MTQAEKLEALVQKARELGWSKHDIWMVRENTKGYLKLIQLPYCAAVEYEWDVEHKLFNKDFARALFGIAPTDIKGFELQMPEFKRQLQQAVISDDPIDYMYRAVFG